MSRDFVDDSLAWERAQRYGRARKYRYWADRSSSRNRRRRWFDDSPVFDGPMLRPRDDGSDEVIRGFGRQGGDSLTGHHFVLIELSSEF